MPRIPPDHRRAMGCGRRSSPLGAAPAWCVLARGFAYQAILEESPPVGSFSRECADTIIGIEA